jgi:hypothetical protein
MPPEMLERMRADAQDLFLVGREGRAAVTARCGIVAA